ncbi:MAG: hypothetical protein KBS83_09330, partial [Lachnospiraceae bacterium]|nr:hypothetical protein [Candidatus Equihabitans merdae]
LENVLYALIPTFWSLVISLIVALIVCGSLVGKHEISKPSRQTVPPVNASNIKHPHHNVIMTGKHHSVRHIPKSKGSSGGGFSGGSFSSGGGGSFSGGGGHF